jgi:hypothetical protein
MRLLTKDYRLRSALLKRRWHQHWISFVSQSGLLALSISNALTTLSSRFALFRTPLTALLSVYQVGCAPLI